MNTFLLSKVITSHVFIRLSLIVWVNLLAYKGIYCKKIAVSRRALAYFGRTIFGCLRYDNDKFITDLSRWSFFFKMATALASFQSQSTMPLSIDYCKGDNCSAQFLSIWAGMRSGSDAFDAYKTC